ncbi:hypothetical protein [Geoalkalibacter halelectricus]|uniref:Uncharacterized protein n=1 Tax=Geoalkalibacter halelectricus TaxID=2847045 RepID=A0ABY5ZRU1_9BACT|nr:hypothetical protein [Geoalkalibacter halelectricus]MDO3377610.1 hypothetical protein [Geoalkalibacter halelectricus]UWZ81401.1 hypothetical protein L9S41_08400 [Geoalkalibacter halelectricus]
MRQIQLRIQKLALVGLVCCLAVLGIFLGQGVQSSSPNNPASLDPLTSAHMQVRGLTYSTYIEDQLVSRIQTDQFLIKPRQFGAVRVRSVNEAVLVNARFEFQERFTAGTEMEEAAESVDFAQGIEGLTQLRGVGRVTRGKIAGMSLVYRQDLQPVLRVGARQAVLDFARGESRLEEVIIECLSLRQRVHAPIVYWDRDAQRFFIPGDYRLEKEPGIFTPGRGLVVDLNGNLYPLPRFQQKPRSFSGFS